MSYEKQTWQTGDVVTSAKLNHMEDGIAGGGGGLVVTVTETSSDDDTVYTMNKTWQEIHDAAENGLVAVTYSSIDSDTSYSYVSSLGYDEFGGIYYLGVNGTNIPQGEDGYATDSANGYPVYTEGHSV